MDGVFQYGTPVNFFQIHEITIPSLFGEFTTEE